MAGTIVRAKALRGDLSHWDGRTITETRSDATGGTITGLVTDNEVDVLQVFGSGTDRTTTTISSALNHINTASVTLVFAPGTWTIDSNLTIGDNFTCRIPAGCVFSVSNGITLTFSGDVLVEDSDNWFTGAGTVVVSREGSHGSVWHRTAAELTAGVTPTSVAVSSRPWTDVVERYGMVGDGTTDNTTAFRNMCLIAGQSLLIKRGTYETSYFTLPENTTLFLEPGTIIRDTGALGSSERFLNITNDNIHIIGWGAEITMVRADYGSGEQRHGVFIYGAQNVLIEGLASNDCGGDGFYVGGANGDPATNVILRNCSGDNNRRQGLSVVNARHFRDYDGQWTNTTGTAPSAGIDIEPNGTTDVMEDVKIIRPRCTGNDGPGIEVFLYAWNSTSNYADIEIISPYTADNGNVSVGGRFRPGIDLNRIGSTTPCRGRVRVVDARCVDENVAGIHVYDWDQSGPLLEIIRASIINPNQLQGVTSTISGGLILHNSTTYTSTPGNVRIEALQLRDDDGYINAASLNPIRVSGAWNLELTDPKITYAGNNPWNVDSTARSVRISTLSPLSVSSSVGLTISDGRYLGRTIHNTGASGTITHTLPAATAANVGWRLSFRVVAEFEMRIDPNASDYIVPLGAHTPAGYYIAADRRGSSITLEVEAANYWRIVEQVGAWVIEANTPTPTYSATNVSTSRTFDADTVAVDALADVVGTMLSDWRAKHEID